MFDGLYQSLMCFFMPYLLYHPANFVTSSGLNINDRTRIGVLVATSAVIASNTYILMNTYRWDWLTVVINAISSLLIFFWTGVYSATSTSGEFYGAASEVYGTLSFWVVLLFTVMACLLPRFSIKAIQKVFFPRDVDIIREQVTQGKFKYLDQFEAYVPPQAAGMLGAGSDASAASSDLGKPAQATTQRDSHVPDDERPFYPPSVAPTANTHNPRSQNGSNGTTCSVDPANVQRPRSFDNPRRSFDRYRRSCDRPRPEFERVRASFEASRDFTSAAMLYRVESSHRASQVLQSPFETSEGE